MTEVEFHTGLADAPGFACRLLRKAARQGARVLVTTPAARLARLDQLLWTFDRGEFLPHLAVAGADAAALLRTPIWLADSLAAAAGRPGAPQVLVNLGADAPASLDGLRRLIELVSEDAGEASAARLRWRGYREAGLAIRHHGGPARPAAAADSDDGEHRGPDEA